MSGGFSGMDVNDVRAFAARLDEASRRLTSTGVRISGTLRQADWYGADGSQFREDWERALRPSLTAAARQLTDAARAAERNADEQQRASTGSSGAGAAGGRFPGAGANGPAGAHGTGDASGSATATAGGSDNDGPGDGGGTGESPWDELLDTARDVLSVPAEAAAEGWDWIQERADIGVANIRDAAADAGETILHFGDMAVSLFNGEPPSVTELVTTELLWAGHLANLVTTLRTVGQVDPNLFDDGSSSAGEPVDVGVRVPGAQAPSVDGHEPTRLPISLEAIATNTGAAYSDGSAVRITKVTTDGQTAVIVNIPGTQTWNPTAPDNPLDATGNLVTASGQQSTATAAVIKAMERADIPPGAPVMLVGHSQGGMIAADMASSPRVTDGYNITNVMTFGSPVDSAHVDPSIDMLAIQHESDVVPKVDLGNLRVDGSSPPRPNGATVVTLHDPPGTAAWDVPGNHDYSEYADSIGEAAAEDGSAVAQYQNRASMAPFLTANPDEVHAVVVPIERNDG